MIWLLHSHVFHGANSWPGGIQVLQMLYGSLGSALQHMKVLTLRCVLPCSPWLGAVHELERLFNDADQASAALLSSQPPLAAGHSSADNAPASLFDDDLDLQATTVAAATGR